MKNFACRVTAKHAIQGIENIRCALLVRVDGDEPPANGDRLRFWRSGMRGEVLQLGLGTCKSSRSCEFSRGAKGERKLRLDGKALYPNEMMYLAREAGYVGDFDWFAYIERTYGLPFNGTLLRW